MHFNIVRMGADVLLGVGSLSAVRYGYLCFFDRVTGSLKKKFT